MSRGRKSLLFWLAAVLGTFCLAMGAFLAAVSHNLFEAGSFGDRVGASLSDRRVSAYVGERLAEAIVQASPDLVAVRPLLVAAASVVVSSRPFAALAASAARRAHQTVFSEQSQQVVLALPDAGVLIRAAVKQASPDLAARIPERFNALIAQVGTTGRAQVLVDLWRLGRRLRWQASTLLLIGPLLVAFALFVAPDRKRGLLHAGVALVSAGLTVAALVPIGRLITLVLIPDPLAGGAAQGVWLTFMGGLRTWGYFYAGLGVLLAAGGTSLLEAVDPVARVRRYATLLVAPPRGRGGRLLWGAALLVLGIAIAWWPAEILEAMAFLAGIGAAYVGVRELFRLILETVAATPAAEDVPTGWRWAIRTPLLVALIALMAAAWIVWRRPAAISVRPALQACNGFAELCDRRVNEVVFAGSHNAMSHQQIPDWMFPHHQAAIPQQLRDGIRALLIDVIHGFPGASRIETDLSAGVPRERLLPVLGAEGIAAAERIRSRLIGVNKGNRQLYFCHGYCELGAYLFEPVLGEIRDFLVANPDEVLLIVIEDQASPQELAAAFERTGLADFVYRGPSSPEWPTLRELIHSGQRLILFLESGNPGVDWLRPAFENFQETPYTFKTPGEFSCSPNRGGQGGTLFLINHWIQTTPAPRPSNAAIVNAHDVLLGRARACAAERSRLPNVIAVDFYRTGDLLRVVNEMNGVVPPTS